MAKPDRVQILNPASILLLIVMGEFLLGEYVETSREVLARTPHQSKTRCGTSTINIYWATCPVGNAERSPSGSASLCFYSQNWGGVESRQITSSLIALAFRGRLCYTVVRGHPTL